MENGKIRLPKLGLVKIKQHRPVPEDWTLKSVTVKQVPSGKYFVSILFEYESQVAEKEPEKEPDITWDVNEKQESFDSNNDNQDNSLKPNDGNLQESSPTSDVDIEDTEKPMGFWSKVKNYIMG